MRRIRFAWWQKPYICRLYIGDGISIHDLWRDEVQYLVDCLQYKDVENYDVPRTATYRDLNHYQFFCHHHDNQDASKVFLACYGEDGEDRWVISYFGLCFNLSKEEGKELVARWKGFTRQESPDWIREGF